MSQAPKTEWEPWSWSEERRLEAQAEQAQLDELIRLQRSGLGQAPGRASPDSIRHLLHLVALQWLFCVLAAVVAGLGWGVAAAVSALAGGAAYLVPNALFAFKVILSANKPDGTVPHKFFMGQFVKIVGTLMLLALAVILAKDQIVWPALLAGLVVVLKSYLMLPWLLRSASAKS